MQLMGKIQHHHTFSSITLLVMDLPARACLQS